MKRITLIMLVLFLFINLCGQRIEYTYDENGNRVSRMLITVEQLQSKTIYLPAIYSVNPNSSIPKQALAGATEDESIEELEIMTEEGEITTIVYPNPNKGLIKIDISNMQPGSNNEMRLYDLNGTELKIVKNFESHTEINISQFKDGIYILRIKINKSIHDWKIIKSH